jgi:hypothetical protein
MNYVDRADLRKMQDFHLLLLATLKLSKESDESLDFDASMSALAKLTNEINDSIIMPSGTDLVDGPSLVRVKDWPPAYRFHAGPRAVSEYWDEWMKFMALWFGLRREDGFNTCHQATWCIHQALIRPQESLPPSRRRELIRRLWNDRWLLEALDVAILLTSYEAEEGISQDSERLARLQYEAMEILKALKMKCGTLNEWFEGLHEISPLIMQGYRLALAERNNAIHRWFDEMQADLAGVLADTIRPYEEGESLLEHQLRAVTWDRDLTPKRSLRFKLNARISFPRFWYEGALAAIDGHGVAPELIEHDVPSAVACAISWDVERFFDSLRTSAMLRRHRAGRD